MSSSSAARLGTILRHLIDLLDGDLEQLYAREVPGFRPRYTPIVRALLESEPRTIREIAETADITHSAASQTVAKMAQDGWLLSEVGRDAREKQVRLSPRLRQTLPDVQAIWKAATAATTALEGELPAPLGAVAEDAVRALSERPFAERLQDAFANQRSEKTPKAKKA